MEISDAELKKCLEAYNYEVPPITSTTRNVLIKKLAKLEEKNQSIQNTIPSKAIDRGERHTLKSSPSVTFHAYDETIEAEEEHETEEDEDEVEHDNWKKEYIRGNASHVLEHALNNQDFMAEKERYRRNRSPVASRFQKTTTTPPVNSTSNYLRNEIYPREIHTTQRRSNKVTSPVTRNNDDNCSDEHKEFIVGNDSNREMGHCSTRSIFRIIVYIAIAFFIVILYEYLTRQDTKGLIS